MFFLLPHLGISNLYMNSILFHNTASYVGMFIHMLALYIYVCIFFFFFYDNIWLPFSYISANNGKVVAACTLHNTMYTILIPRPIPYFVMEHNFSDPRKANEKKKKKNLSLQCEQPFRVYVLRNDIWKDRSPTQHIGICIEVHIQASSYTDALYGTNNIPYTHTTVRHYYLHINIELLSQTHIEWET